MSIDEELVPQESIQALTTAIDACVEALEAASIAATPATVLLLSGPIARRLRLKFSEVATCMDKLCAAMSTVSGVELSAPAELRDAKLQVLDKRAASAEALARQLEAAASTEGGALAATYVLQALLDEGVPSEELVKEESRTKLAEDVLALVIDAEEWLESSESELIIAVASALLYTDPVTTDGSSRHSSSSGGSASDVPPIPEPVPSPAARLVVHKSFLCPITQLIMRDPVSTSAGHTYERSAIESWLQSKNTDPRTRERLNDCKLTPNWNLKSVIDEWLTAADMTHDEYDELAAFNETVARKKPNRPGPNTGAAAAAGTSAAAAGTSSSAAGTSAAAMESPAYGTFAHVKHYYQVADMDADAKLFLKDAGISPAIVRALTEVIGEVSMSDLRAGAVEEAHVALLSLTPEDHRRLVQAITAARTSPGAITSSSSAAAAAATSSSSSPAARAAGASTSSSPVTAAAARAAGASTSSSPATTAAARAAGASISSPPATAAGTSSPAAVAVQQRRDDATDGNARAGEHFRAAGGPRLMDYVTVAPRYARELDADLGPLTPGKYGIVIIDNRTNDKPLRVRSLQEPFAAWWYARAALQAVAAGAVPAEARLDFPPWEAGKGAPVIPSTCKPGMLVRRGYDWLDSADANGQNGEVGVVMGISQGKAEVLWANGGEGVYGLGLESKFELQHMQVQPSSGAPVVDEAAVTPGSAVVRGMHWASENSTRGLIGSLLADAEAGFVAALWPNHKLARYRASTAQGFDLNYCSRPGEPVTIFNAQAGLKVVRGRDWKWGPQDEDGSVGVLVRPTRVVQDGMLWEVLWESGTKMRHRVGRPTGNWCDLQVATYESAGSSGWILQGTPVVLSSDYTSVGDADLGPLSPDEVGVVTSVGGRGTKYRVLQLVTRKLWWYERPALRPLPSTLAVKKCKGMKLNRDGRAAFLGGDIGTGGDTAKPRSAVYYCGIALGQCRCGKCDGRCGPDQGCPCHACAELIGQGVTAEGRLEDAAGSSSVVGVEAAKAELRRMQAGFATVSRTGQ